MKQPIINRVIMKRLYYIVIVAFIAIVGASCTEREYSLEHGYDIKSYISANVSGTVDQYSKLHFFSDTGVYSDYYHPEFRMHDDGTFSFDLKRRLTGKNNSLGDLKFVWDNVNGTIELDKVYSLKVVGESRASFGMTLSDNIYREYHATDGWIVFTSKRVYSDGLLYTGEFRFEGVAEDGDRMSVTDGYIIDCRICVADDYGCMTK